MEDQNDEQQKRFAAWKIKAKAIIDEATLDGHHHVLVVHGTHGNINVTGATCPGFIMETGTALLHRGISIAIDN
jgi:hypothetical protein